LAPSVHVGVPVAQASAPTLHGAPGLDEQLAPTVQATQAPLPLQTWLAPQLVPPATSAASTQARAPVAHEVTPVLHGALGFVAHAVPAVQAMQLPLPSHTWSLPHAVPPATLAESTQLATPPAHDVTPLLHGAAGLVVHAAPAVHGGVRSGAVRRSSAARRSSPLDGSARSAGDADPELPQPTSADTSITAATRPQIRIATSYHGESLQWCAALGAPCARRGQPARALITLAYGVSSSQKIHGRRQLRLVQPKRR
jgi:hypothetical protein